MFKCLGGFELYSRWMPLIYLFCFVCLFLLLLFFFKQIVFKYRT